MFVFREIKISPKKGKKILSLHGLHSVLGLHGMQSAECAFWGDRGEKAVQCYSTLYFDFT